MGVRISGPRRCLVRASACSAPTRQGQARGKRSSALSRGRGSARPSRRCLGPRPWRGSCRRGEGACSDICSRSRLASTGHLISLTRLMSTELLLLPMFSGRESSGSRFRRPSARQESPRPRDTRGGDGGRGRGGTTDANALSAAIAVAAVRGRCGEAVPGVVCSLCGADTGSGAGGRGGDGAGRRGGAGGWERRGCKHRA